MIIIGKGHPAEDSISLLQCIVEQMVEPTHLAERCGTNDCPRCVFDHYKKELEEDFCKPVAKRAFPMLDGSEIPWELARAFWDTVYDPLYHDQSLARLAERGGFAWEELKTAAAKAKSKGLF